jgi:hypothetical protein
MDDYDLSGIMTKDWGFPLLEYLIRHKVGRLFSYLLGFSQDPKVAF